MPHISLQEVIDLLPQDPRSREAAVAVLVVALAVAGGAIWALVDQLCTYSGLPLLNEPPTRSIHRDPPKRATAAKGFEQVVRIEAVRRQQLDAIVQGQHAAKCVGYISPAEPYGRTRAEGWR